MTAVAALGACLLLASGVTGAGLAHDVAPSAPLGAGLGRGRAESPLQRIVVAKAEAASSGGSVEKSVFIRATPEECFRVATAYEDYPKWAKATAGVSVLSRTGELGKQVEMRMGMFGIEVKSTFEYSYNRPTQMEWKSVAGNIKELHGQYTFLPEGEGTKVIYKLRVEPGFPLPNMVKQATNRAICTTALGELKSYTENPKTLARLRGANGKAGVSRQQLHEQLLEACLSSAHIM